MIDKKISVSEQVANLESSDNQLFFTWGIPHADDCGLLPRSARQLRAIIFPMKENITVEQVEEFVKKEIKVGLAKEFEYSGTTYFQILNFYKYQTLKKDRMPYTLFQMPDKIKKPVQAWEYLESIGFQLEDSGNQMEAELNRSEEKGIEEKRKNTVTQSVTPVLKARRVRNTKPKRNTDEVISLPVEIKRLEESKKRWENIVALYLEHRKPDLRTWGQLEVALNRHSKAAARLKTFSDDQIVKGFTQAKKQTEEWTLETVMKQLTK